MSQTTYNLQATEAFVGKLVDASQPKEVRTGLAAEELNAGDLVYVSSWTNNSLAFSKLTTGNLIPFGVVLHENRETGRFPTNTDVPILRKGVIWVENTSGAVTAGQYAAVVHTAGANLGKLRSVPTLAGATNGNIFLHGTQFLSAGAEGVLVKLQINFPAYAIVKS